jgi:hypothetical protein
VNRLFEEKNSMKTGNQRATTRTACTFDNNMTSVVSYPNRSICPRSRPLTPFLSRPRRRRDRVQGSPVTIPADVGGAMLRNPPKLSGCAWPSCPLDAGLPNRVGCVFYQQA